MLAAVLSVAAPAKPTHAGANYSLTITGGPSNCNETSKAHAGDTATFHYVLRYDASSAVRSPDASHPGDVIDSSRERGEPLEAKLDGASLIPGMERALVGLCVGASAIAVVPPELGYGAKGSGGIPGGATLNFELELLRARKVFSPFDMYEQYFESQPPWTQVRIMLLRSLGPRDFIDVDANLDGHVSASELRAALVKIDEKHADPVPLENYGDALHEFDFDSDKRLSIYEWRYVPWPRRAYHTDEGHERG